MSEEYSKKLIPKICEYSKCGKLFYTYSKRAKYCSAECAKKAWSEDLKSPKKEMKENEKKKRRKTKKSYSIKEVVRYAEEHQVSYGRAVVMMEEEDDLSGI